MVDGSHWRQRETRSPSVIPDDEVRESLELESAHLFATQLQTRLRTIEHTHETPKFLRRNSYDLYLEGHFALLDPRDLERTTISPTPPSSSDWLSPVHTPESLVDSNHHQVHPGENGGSQIRSLQRQSERKKQRPQGKRGVKRLNQKKHHQMLRRSDRKETTLYELEWVGGNTVTVCQPSQNSDRFVTKKS